MIAVAKPPEGVELLPQQLSVAAGDTKSLSAVLSPSGSAGGVTYACENPEIASVDAGGRVKGIAAGETTVRATTYNGQSAGCSVKVVPEPQAITIVAGRAALGVGEKYLLDPQIAPIDVDASLSFSSSKPSVASVSGAGLVTAKKTGTAVITVKAYNGVKTAIKIQVKKAPSKVTAQIERTKLGLGEEARISGTLSSGSAGAVGFSSSNQAVATVDASGVIRTVGEGSAKITATTYNKKSDSLVIAVVHAPQSVAVSPKDVALGVGQSQVLTCALPKDSAGAVSYSSSDETIAKVDAKTGKLTAVGAGQATITATAYNGASDAMTATIKPAPEWVKLESASLSIGVGETRALSPIIPENSATTFSYATSAKKYVTVDTAGVLKGVKAGTAEITVKTYNGKWTTLSVSVMKAPSSLSLKTKQLTLGVGESRAMQYALPNGTASGVQAVSANPEVVAVGAGNLLTAVGLGEAVVTFSTFNGKTDSCTVSVVNAPTGISISPQGGVLGVGQTLALSAQVDAGKRLTAALFKLRPGDSDRVRGWTNHCQGASVRRRS